MCNWGLKMRCFFLLKILGDVPIQPCFDTEMSIHHFKSENMCPLKRAWRVRIDWQVLWGKNMYGIDAKQKKNDVPAAFCSTHQQQIWDIAQNPIYECFIDWGTNWNTDSKPSVGDLLGSLIDHVKSSPCSLLCAGKGRGVLVAFWLEKMPWTLSWYGRCFNAFHSN